MDKLKHKAIIYYGQGWLFEHTGVHCMNPFRITKPVIGTAKIEIHKSVANVFLFVGEKFFKNYPKWALEVSEFKPLNGESIFVGAKAQQVRIEHGQRVESIFEVSEFDPPLKVTLSGVDAPYRNSYHLFSTDNLNSTELEFSFEIIE